MDTDQDTDLDYLDPGWDEVYADYEDERYRQYEAEQAERGEQLWRGHVAALYADYVADCEADGEDPVPLAEWEEDYVDSLVAEAERRAEEGLR